MKEDRPLCPRCLKRRPRGDMRIFDPDEGRWKDLEACKPCLSNGRKAT